jgi:hypothetical protein
VQRPLLKGREHESVEMPFQCLGTHT